MSRSFYLSIRKICHPAICVTPYNVTAPAAQIEAKQIARRYGVAIGQPEDREWRMRDFTLFDPSGVLWRIAQDLD
jgi:hypothetical protein